MIAGLPRIVNITDIAMAPAAGDEKLTTSCTAVVYRFVEPEKKEDKGKKKKKRKK